MASIYDGEMNIKAENLTETITSGQVYGIEIGKDSILKTFVGHGLCKGIVRSFKYPYFLIVYEDGDQEDMDIEELRHYLNRSEFLPNSRIRPSISIETGMASQLLNAPSAPHNATTLAQPQQHPHQTGVYGGAGASESTVLGVQPAPAELALYGGMRSQIPNQALPVGGAEVSSMYRANEYAPATAPMDFLSLTHAAGMLSDAATVAPAEMSTSSLALWMASGLTSAEHTDAAALQTQPGEVPTTNPAAWMPAETPVTNSMELPKTSPSWIQSVLPATSLAQISSAYATAGVTPGVPTTSTPEFIETNLAAWMPTGSAAAGAMELPPNLTAWMPADSLPTTPSEEPSTTEAAEIPPDACPKTIEAPESSQSSEIPQDTPTTSPEELSATNSQPARLATVTVLSTGLTGASGSESIGTEPGTRPAWMTSGQANGIDVGDKLWSSMRCKGCVASGKKCTREWPHCSRCTSRQQYPNPPSCEYPEKAIATNDPTFDFRAQVMQLKMQNGSSTKVPATDFAAAPLANGEVQYSSLRCKRCAALKSKCPREWPQCSRCVRRCENNPDAPPCAYPAHAVPGKHPDLTSRARLFKKRARAVDVGIECNGTELWSSHRCVRCAELKTKCSREWPQCARCRRRSANDPSAPVCRYPEKAVPMTDQETHFPPSATQARAGDNYLWSTMKCECCTAMRSKCPRQWPECSRCERRCKADPSAPTCKYPEKAVAVTENLGVASRSSRAQPLVKGEAGPFTASPSGLWASMRCNQCVNLNKHCSREWPHCERCEWRCARDPETAPCQYPAKATTSPNPNSNNHTQQLRVHAVAAAEVSQMAVDEGQLWSSMRCAGCADKKRKCTREWPECARCVKRRMLEPGAPLCEYPANALTTDNPSFDFKAQFLKLKEQLREQKKQRRLHPLPDSSPLVKDGQNSACDSPPITRVKLRKELRVSKKIRRIGNEEMLWSSMRCIKCADLNKQCTREWPRCSRCREKYPDLPCCEYPEQSIATGDPSFDYTAQMELKKTNPSQFQALEDRAATTREALEQEAYAEEGALGEGGLTSDFEEVAEELANGANALGIGGTIDESAAPAEGQEQALWSNMRCQRCVSHGAKCTREWPHCSKCLASRIRYPDTPDCLYPEKAVATTDPDYDYRAYIQGKQPNPCPPKPSKVDSDPEGSVWSNMRCVRCAKHSKPCPREWPHCSKCLISRSKNPNTPECTYPDKALRTLTRPPTLPSRRFFPPKGKKRPRPSAEAASLLQLSNGDREWSDMRCMQCASQKVKCTREWPRCYTCLENPRIETCCYPPEATAEGDPAYDSVREELLFFRSVWGGQRVITASMSCAQCSLLKRKCPREWPHCSRCVERCKRDPGEAACAYPAHAVPNTSKASGRNPFYISALLSHSVSSEDSVDETDESNEDSDSEPEEKGFEISLLI